MDWTQYFSQNDEAVALLPALIWKNDTFQCSILNKSHKNQYSMSKFFLQPVMLPPSGRKRY